MAKKKKRPIEDDDYDDDYTEATRKRSSRDDDDDPSEKPKPKARNNAFTGMLAISLLALFAAATLFYLDFDALSGTIPQPSVTVPELGAAVAPGR